MDSYQETRTIEFTNVYDDAQRAEAYAKLEFPGTYYLAYRDIPRLIGEHVTGTKALDFGCGTGRSTVFLRKLGFEVVGVDISPDMLNMARKLDPAGDYRLIAVGDFRDFPDGAFDVILSAFTFDNIPTMEKKVSIFSGLRRLLNPGGAIINLVSSPEIYTHEWASFTTKEFPENRFAKSGDKVKIVMTDVPDQRPVEDIIWFDDAYQEVYDRTGLRIAGKQLTLAGDDDPGEWVNEREVSPWVIYVLKQT